MPSEHLPGRFKSAWVDLAACTLILIVVAPTTDELARSGLGIPNPTGPDNRDGLGLVSLGFAALCANVYLAICAAKGRSVGKALFGLRLVVADGAGKPGLARGLVRSSLQAGPWMGALMALTGAHDNFAGTRIVTDVQDGSQQFVREFTTLPTGRSHVAKWRVAFAIALHLFCPFVYMILGAA